MNILKLLENTCKIPAGNGFIQLNKRQNIWTLL